MPCDSSSGGKSHFRCRISRFYFFHLFVVAVAVATASTGSGSTLGSLEEGNNKSMLKCKGGKIGETSHVVGMDGMTFKDVLQPTKRTLIVGGRDAPRNRYPYFVSLQEVYNGNHKCGGSLVAPDVVLTAAHCERNIKYAHVGKYDLREDRTQDQQIVIDEDGIDKVETFEVTGPVYPHPLYNSGVSFSYDVLLFKLNRKSKNQYIRINTDPNRPGASSSSDIGQQGARNNNYKDITSTNNTDGNNLTVMGIGSTHFEKNDSTAPRVLQETTTSFVPNRVCRRSKAPDLDDNYQNLISDDMLCAFEEGQDACQGDSGGPLIYKGHSASSDILVGIVSWGFGCAHPSFPGVYSRVSHYSDWVIATICELSSEPPLEYDCANVLAPSQENSVPITVIIQFDDHPAEVSWSIGHLESETVLVNVTEDLDTVPGSRSQETVSLPPGSNLIFTIRDRYGDGLCCSTPGNFRVVLGRNAVGKVLAFGGGNFGREESHTFRIPADFVEEEEKPLLGDDQIPLIVVIQLDRYPHEIGWRIDRLGTEVDGVIRIPAGMYTAPETTIIRPIILEKNELYYFNIYDIMEDGINAGHVQLFLGTFDISDSSRMIFESDGNFQSGTDHTFFAAFPAADMRPPSDNYMYLTLVMKMDLYPGEISVQLRIDADEEHDSDSIIFFRPPNYYKDRVNEIVFERISIPRPASDAKRQFSFIIADRSGDGMCCAWNGEVATGYILYDGDPSNDHIIVDSRFELLSREVTSFNFDGVRITGGNSDGIESEESIINIRITLVLDAYPEETGFFITNSFGEKLYYAPPGTFIEPDGVFERDLNLKAGLYSFNIIDTFGDGVDRKDSVYSIDVIGDSDRLSILKGTGNFLAANSQSFLLEGDEAQYPLQINMKTGGMPQEFAFTIYRLDRVEAAASIASKSKGEYKVRFQDVSERLFVTKGGLYKIVFENSFYGVAGTVKINLGSSDSGSNKVIEYTFDSSETKDAEWWEVKLYADEPMLQTEDNGRILILKVQSYCFSVGFDWMMLSNHHASMSNSALPLTHDESQILGYGSIALGNEMKMTDVHHEKIIIPRLHGNHSYTMIISANDNFEVCQAVGVLLNLYDGQANDTSLVSFDRIEQGRRIVLIFSLAESGSACFCSLMHFAFKLTAALTVVVLFSIGL